MQVIKNTFTDLMQLLHRGLTKIANFTVMLCTSNPRSEERSEERPIEINTRKRLNTILTSNTKLLFTL